MHAFPMRLRDTVIGALNLLSADTPGLSAEDAAGALASRVVIEQTKGMVAERSQVPMEQAFGMLRSDARSNQLRLDHVAHGVIDGRLGTDMIPTLSA